MKKAFYFIFFSLISKILFSQIGTPFIHTYLPEEYRAEGQIWCAEQDPDGIMYFGSNSGVLIYDGSSWQIVKLPNNNPVRSLGKDQGGKIYVGSVGEFGYLASDKRNGFKYVSLSKNTDSLSKHFTDVWTIRSSGNTVYFATGEFLFRYNARKIPSLKTLKTNTAPFLLYKPRKQVLVSLRGTGTNKIIGDSIVPLKGLAETHPWFMISYNNHFDIIGNLYGLSIYNPDIQNSDKLTDDKTVFNNKNIAETNKFLQKNQLYTGAVNLGNGKYAVGTIRKGIIIIEKTGKIYTIIDERKGLPSNTIHALFIDSENELWACTAYGIAKIDINSPYELFNESYGLSGSIYDVIRFHNIFYVSSNLGLYYYAKGKFKGVKGLSGKDAVQILSPFIFKTDSDSLFYVNTIYGMQRITEKGSISVNRINYSSIIQSDYIKNTVYFTENYDLYKMVYQDHAFLSPEKIHKFDKLVDIGEEFNKDNLILILNEKPILYNLKTNSFENIKIDTKIKDINKIDTLITANTENGLFIYNSEKKTFIRDRFFTENLIGDNEILQFEKFAENNYWLLARNNKTNKTFTAEIDKKNQSYLVQTIPYKRFSGISTIHKDGDSILWALNNKTLYKYTIHNQKNFSQKAFCLIRKISLKNDSVIFTGVLSAKSSSENSKNKPIINYNLNDILFKFTLTSYEGAENEFSYKIENGEKSNWSDWSGVNFKEYSNLNEGTYTFYVKGRNVYGTESNPVAYTFIISPPWYRTVTAYMSYLILLIFVIWGFVKLNAKRLEKENIRLDNIVKNRTAELLTQKEEIQTQADYLEEVNNELNQKNEEINTIAENLKEANTKIKEKNKYITDSINYAQKIQSAVLPSDQEISKHISDYFLIYKPKDIVSGDFYFIKKRGDYLIPAVADCTGHGVPGGFLAMMGMAVLSDIVQDERITNPAAALEEMRKAVKRSLHQNKYLDSQSEGIEIALCAINTKDLSLEFAGANHPLFIVRQEDNEEAKIIEISADAQPVGIHYKEKPFKLNKFQLQENDMLYMFSDGYFDQFGGPNKKKFLLKKLKELLIEVSNESMKIQKRTLLNAFNSWKGKNKQVDDVLLFGIRVKDF